MKTLNNPNILKLWESGQHQHPIDRGLAILMAVLPDMLWDDLVQLCIGQRNRYLLNVREQTFGNKLNGVAVCSHCQKELEFIADVDEIRSQAGDGRSTYSFSVEGYDIRFRLVNSSDLAKAANVQNASEARQILLNRCVLNVMYNEANISIQDLPERLESAVSDEMARRDPQALMVIDVDCPECGRGLAIAFDIVPFLWREINALAKRLLREVHILARYYGWPEADILSMSATRRHFYLEMAQS